MKQLLIITIAVIISLAAAKLKDNVPDLSNKSDLDALGVGKIFETDNTLIKKIMLHAVTKTHIEYIKDGSLHDLALDKIHHLEFSSTKWGEVWIEFQDTVPKFKIFYTR